MECSLNSSAQTWMKVFEQCLHKVDLGRARMFIRLNINTYIFFKGHIIPLACLEEDQPTSKRCREI